MRLCPRDHVLIFTLCSLLGCASIISLVLTKGQLYNSKVSLDMCCVRVCTRMCGKLIFEAVCVYVCVCVCVCVYVCVCVCACVCVCVCYLCIVCICTCVLFVSLSLWNSGHFHTLHLHRCSPYLSWHWLTWP